MTGREEGLRNPAGRLDLGPFVCALHDAPKNLTCAAGAGPLSEEPHPHPEAAQRVRCARHGEGRSMRRLSPGSSRQCVKPGATVIPPPLFLRIRPRALHSCGALLMPPSAQPRCPAAQRSDDDAAAAHGDVSRPQARQRPAAPVCTHAVTPCTHSSGYKKSAPALGCKTMYPM